ncbi:MAG: hypothetical protein WC875_00825 [Candidatus Absconditabacterales bacterium]|jgi:hypothetical protein
MTKKEYILKMIDLIKDIFPPAKDLKILIQGDVVSDEMINTLVVMLKEVRQAITDEAEKAKLDKSIEFMNKLKASEATEHIQDEKKLKELEEIFNSI